MEREGLIELKINVRDYSKYFLSQNPFPAVGVPEEFPRITVDRELIKLRFQNVISEVINTNKTIITVMVGEYGSGKSHLLKLFRNSVNAQLLTRETGALAVYVKSPGEDFSDLFFAIVDGIGKELLVDQINRFLNEELNTSDYSKLIFDTSIRDDYVQKKATIRQILSKSQYIEIFKRISKKYFGQIKSTDAIFSFLNLAHPDNSTKAWRWFLGQRLGKEDLEALNADQEIDVNNAYQLFLDIVNILRIMGIKHLVILIDELEKITLLPSTKRAKYQDQLRQMIDDNPSGMCFYFAIAPRQWDALTKETTALVRRLAANWYVLDDFKTSETRELIEAYLFSVRTPDYKADKIRNVLPKCEPSLYPFTNDAIDAISKKSKGVVSNILTLGRISLEILQEKPKQYPVVTPELINKEIEKI